MSERDVARFFLAALDDAPLVARCNGYGLAELVFHAKSLGYVFSASELAAMAGKLEYATVTTKDGQSFDGASRLWREMWGIPHFEYVIDKLVARHTEEELLALVAPGSDAPASVSPGERS